MAPTAAAAPRVSIRMSAREANPGRASPGTSGSQVPEPSASNRATYSVPSSSGLRLRPARRHGRAETNLYRNWKRSSSPVYTTARPSSASAKPAFSCFTRPSAVRFFGVEPGSPGSISTTHPKRFGSFGLVARSKRASPSHHGLSPRADPVAAHQRRRREARSSSRSSRLKFSSHVRYVPHGVQPLAQLFDRAEHLAPGRIGGRLQQGVPGRRAGQLHRRVGRDAPGVVRADHAPRTVAQLQLGDRHAVGVLRLADRLRLGVVGGGREQPGRRVDRLVVDDEQAAPAAEREERHAVVAGAELLLLIGGGVRGVELERRTVGLDRITPRDQDLGGVALGNGQDVVDVRGDRREAERRSGGVAGPTAVRRVLPDRVGRGAHGARGGSARGGRLAWRGDPGERGDRAERRGAADEAAAAEHAGGSLGPPAIVDVVHCFSFGGPAADPRSE